MDPILANFGAHFGVQMLPKSGLKRGPEIEPEKVQKRGSESDAIYSLRSLQYGTPPAMLLKKLAFGISGLQLARPRFSHFGAPAGQVQISLILI